jgi:hypothetical protein
MAERPLPEWFSILVSAFFLFIATPGIVNQNIEMTLLLPHALKQRLDV